MLHPPLSPINFPAGMDKKTKDNVESKPTTVQGLNIDDYVTDISLSLWINS